MFIEVTRSQAVTALLEGKEVFMGALGDSRGAVGAQLGSPESYSRRRAMRVLSRWFYEDNFYPRHAHADYWVHEGEWDRVV